MELVKWQNIIVEWVNCLNISSPIQSLSDLKNEEFFRKLLSFITGDHSTECVSLLDFLKKHYPFYHLHNESTLVKDDIEICNVCSLLLHYSCVIDGRPQLTAPLCKALSTESQLRVKSVLEILQMSETISREMLNIALLNINKHENSPKKVEPTPLVEYFRTPHKKAQSVEIHRQHVKQLESQLDLQRYEKEELQEELVQQQERNKKLDRTVLEKQAEISRLKAQLLALENGTRTPPASAKKDGRLEARRLRQELVSLEKYVQTLNSEQNELQDECVKAQNKVSELEKQVSFWQTEAQIALAEVTKLREVHASTQIELAALQERSEELTSLLAELRPKNPYVHDESLEGSPCHLNLSGSIDNENLARTVVDLQLTEVQEDNKRLQLQLSELDFNNKELISKIKLLQHENQKVLQEKNDLLNCNNNLHKKMTENETNSFELKSKLSETEFNLLYFKNEAETLNSEIKNCQETNENLSEQLSRKTIDFDVLFREKQSVDNKLDFWQGFSKRFDEILTHISQKHNFTFDGQIIEKLENMVRAYEFKIIKDRNDINDYQKKVNDLQNEINLLRKSEELCKIEEKKLAESLENTKLKLKSLQNDIHDYKNHITNKNEQVLQLDIENNELIFMLQKSETKITNMELELTENKKTLAENLQIISVLNQNFETISQEKIELEKSLEEKNQLNNEYKFSIENLKQNLSEQLKSQQILQEKVSNMAANLEKSNTQIVSLEKALESSNTQIENYKFSLKEKTQYIEDLNEEISTLKTELQRIENSLSEELSEKKCLQENCESFSTNLKKLESIIDNLKSQKSELEKTVACFNEIILAHEKTKDDLEQKCEKLNLIISDIESQMKLLQDDNLILNQQLETLNKTAEHDKKTIDNLQKQKHDLTCEIEKLNNELKTAEVSNNCFKQKLEQLTENLNEKREILLELQNKKTSYKEQLKNLENDIYEINEEKNELEINLEKISLTLEDKEIKMKKLELEKVELKQQLEQMNNAYTLQTNEYKNKLTNYETDVKTSTNKLELVSSEVSQIINTISKEKLNVFLQTETDLLIKISNLETSIYALISDRRLLKIEIANLTHLIFDNEQKISELKEKNNILQLNLDTNKCNLKNYQKKLTDVKQKLDETMENTGTLLQNHEQDISDYKNQISQLRHELESHKKQNCETTKLKLNLSESSAKIEKLQYENSHYQKIIKNLQDTLKDKDDFIFQLDKKIQEFKLDAESSNKFEKLNNFCIESINKHVSLYSLVFDVSFEVKNFNFDKLYNEISILKSKSQTISDLQLEVAKTNKELSEKLIQCKNFEQEIALLKTTSTNWQKISKEQEIQNKKLQHEIDTLSNLQISYTNLLKDNSQLQLDYKVLRTTIDERNSQIGNLTLIKDSYEKLLEENNKLHTELDTLKYKRTRDKDEFKRILNEATISTDQQIQQVRSEYEDKLKKMKDKIVKLYREEVEKEKKKVCTLQQGQSEDTIASLKSQLWLTGNKYADLKREYDTVRSRLSQYQSVGDRKAFTLPRDSKVEVTRETVSVSLGLAMEDEQGELFNNTYLADLKSGRCEVDSCGRSSTASTSSRLSELQFRNSLCPPHLKSSYPAETQYEQIQEDEIKLGLANCLDDSSSKLLPGDRPRNKKDIGQTLYKKPGPPTPSKNGGRLSLQGNEVLKELNKPAGGTPSRLRALFSRSARDQENVSSSTPRSQTKRRSIFRR